MIDLHCHILPGLDDGPSDVAESIEMARLAVSDGIQTIVATPHTLNQIHSNPLSEVDASVSRMQRILHKEQIAIDLLPGSDVQLCRGMVNRILNREVATINGNKRYILVEFPFMAVPNGANEEIFQLKLHNITPVITHPERIPAFQHRMDILHKLVTMGCLIQVTAMSITGEFGKGIMESAHMLLNLRMAHIIASDAHSARKRPPILSHAVEVAAGILGSMSEAEAMVMDRPRAVIDGKPVEVPDPRTLQKKRWRLW